jgi:hypothetical protein
MGSDDDTDDDDSERAAPATAADESAGGSTFAAEQPLRRAPAPAPAPDDDDDDPFATATNYGQLLVANMRFIRGELHRSPYHCSPTPPRYAPELADALVELNKYGVFTQDVWVGGRTSNGYLRPMIDFFIPKTRQAPYLLENMFQSSDEFAIEISVWKPDGKVISRDNFDKNEYDEEDGLPVEWERSWDGPHEPVGHFWRGTADLVLETAYLDVPEYRRAGELLRSMAYYVQVCAVDAFADPPMDMAYEVLARCQAFDLSRMPDA